MYEPALRTPKFAEGDVLLPAYVADPVVSVPIENTKRRPASVSTIDGSNMSVKAAVAAMPYLIPLLVRSTAVGATLLTVTLRLPARMSMPSSSVTDTVCVRVEGPSA